MGSRGDGERRCIPLIDREAIVMAELPVPETLLHIVARAERSSQIVLDPGLQVCRVAPDRGELSVVWQREIEVEGGRIVGGSGGCEPVARDIPHPASIGD